MPGKPRRSSLKWRLPNSSSRTISGVQRSARISHCLQHVRPVRAEDWRSASPGVADRSLF